MPDTASEEGEIIEAYPDDIAKELREWEAEMRERAAKAPPFAPASVVQTLKCWKPGATVRVAFLGGSTALRTDIAAAAREWSRHGNFTFDFGPDEAKGRYRSWTRNDKTYAADIRVSFSETTGYWSHVGTDSRNSRACGPGSPSMSLQRFDGQRPASWRGTTLHEFGHALGFHHEHQNPSGGCDDEFRWTTGPNGEASVYTLLGRPPNSWPPAKVDFNLRQLPNSAAYATSMHDPESIMHYRFPANYFVTGASSRCYVSAREVLSDGDRKGVADAYPSAPGAIQAVIEGRKAAFDALMKMESVDAEDRDIYRQQLDALEVK